MNTLLNWALIHSDPAVLRERAAEIESGESKPKYQLPDRKWIDLLLKSDAEKMKDELKIFQDPNASLKEREDALEELESLVQQIDNACDLHKIGGLVPIVNALNNEPPSIQMRCAWILGTCVQNNPTVQKLFMELSVVQPLLSLFTNTQDPDVRAKTVYAISGFLKNYKEGVEHFAQFNGIALLSKVLATKELASKRKIIFLFTQLMKEHRYLQDVLRESGALQLIANQLNEEQDLDLHEKALQALFEILQGNAHNIQLALDIDLPERLRQFEQTLKKEDNEDLFALIQNIQNLLRENSTKTEETPNK